MMLNEVPLPAPNKYYYCKGGNPFHGSTIKATAGGSIAFTPSSITLESAFPLLLSVASKNYLFQMSSRYCNMLFNPTGPG